MSSQLAERISRVPELYAASNKSTAALLKEAGLPDRRHDLRVPDVEEALARNPELAALWLERASDQRLVGGWGIECSGDSYCIRDYARHKGIKETDRLHATAEFVVRYVDFIGDVLHRWQ